MTPITKLIPTLSLVLALGVFVSSAHADPCKAIPDRGPTAPWVRALTKPGVVFSGPVVAWVDSDGLCAAAVPGRERDPTTWVEVRLADYFGLELHEPGGKKEAAALKSITTNQRVYCTVTRGKNNKVRSFDRVVAVCRINGVSLGDLMRAGGNLEGGRGAR